MVIVAFQSGAISEIVGRMGITNRDYYRDTDGSSGGRYLNDTPTSRWLLYITIGMFVLQLVLVDPRGRSIVTEWFGANPNRILHGEVWRVATYAFLHSPRDLLHIVFNMMVLWSFGPGLERLYGSREFLGIYLGGAIAGGLAAAAWGLVSGGMETVLGASAALMGLMTLFAITYPHEKVSIFGLISIEAVWLVVLMAAYDFYSVLVVIGGAAPLDHISHSAHLGGLLFGILYSKASWKLTGWFSAMPGRWVKQARNVARRNPLKVYQPVEEEVADIEAEVDRILAKIYEQGSESLTPQERTLLNRASEKYKNRR